MTHPAPARRPSAFLRAVWLVTFGPFYLIWIAGRALLPGRATASSTQKD